MAVAKVNTTAYKNFDIEKIKKRLKKGAKAFAGRVFPTQVKTPGQADYPAIPEALKAQKRRRKLLEEMDSNVTRIGR